MGFDLSQVISESQHYGPFICNVCHNLVEHDAVVTNECSHPFCRECLAGWANECGGNKASSSSLSCPCPSCKTELSSNDLASMNLGGLALAARPLEEAQPLAYQVLMQVQVTCIHFSPTEKQKQCKWIGDYSEFVHHAAQHAGGDAVQRAFFARSNCATPSPGAGGNRRPTLSRHKSNSLPYLLAGLSPTNSPRASPSNGKNRRLVGVQQQQQLQDRMSASLRDLRSDDPANRVSNMMSSLPALNVLVTAANDDNTLGNKNNKNNNNNNNTHGGTISPRWKSTNSSISSPVPATSEKSAASPPPPPRDAPPNLVIRQSSDDENVKINKKNASTSRQLQALKRKPSMSDHDDDNNNNNRAENTDLEVSYSHALDWNNSIGSAGGWNNSFCEGGTGLMETVHEVDSEDEQSKDTFQLVFEPDEEATAEEEARSRDPSVITKQIIEKAEKLKKQANAKFNKGDFTGSRVLYTEGITVMKDVTPNTPEERDLVSNLHSNRAVTFFREKKFQSCIEDCDKALACDPAYEKSWIRKWRALMALGDFDSAYECLQMASQMVPNSKRIQVELDKAQKDMNLVTTAREHIAKGEFTNAKEILRPYARSTDNIGLLFVAAKADACLGHTESALEKVNKALRFNPTHREGLELRGYTLFLSGDMEKGAHLLQEAYSRDKENKATRRKLVSCQNTHSSFAKGRSSVKRGRYKDAVDHFTVAIEESGDVPRRSPLFISLKTERAEAWLLLRGYAEAMKDCQDVIDADSENATAWTLRAEVLIALGKADEAMNELSGIRRTWGWDNPTINEGYRRVDFELRVLKADDDLCQFVADLESGKTDKLTGTDAEGRTSKRSGQHNGEKKSERRTNRTGRNLPRDSRSRSRSRRRRSGSADGEKSGGERRSSNPNRKHNNDETRGSGDKSAAVNRKSSFVPPPSIEDMTKENKNGEQRSNGQRKSSRRT